MGTQINFLTEGYSAITTYKWPLSCMKSCMHVQTWHTLKAFFTIFTLICLPGMSVHMILQDVCSTKRLLTNTTHKWFLFGMNAHMSLHVACFIKRLVTNTTYKCFPVCMHSCMALQFWCTVIAFSANVTFICLSSMNSHMPLQVTCFTKRLVTNTTSVRFLASMNPYMSVQVACLTKWLVTNTITWLFAYCKGGTSRMRN